LGRETGAGPSRAQGWPGYVPRRAVRWGRATIGASVVVVVCWDFDVLGGSFGGLLDHPDLDVRNVLVPGAGHHTLPFDRRAVEEIARALRHLDTPGQRVE
jgi:hypothetical protein